MVFIWAKTDRRLERLRHGSPPATGKNDGSAAPGLAGFRIISCRLSAKEAVSAHHLDIQ